MIEKGPKEVTCRECGAVGIILIGRALTHERVKVTDNVQHKETCSHFRRPQPAHLRNKTSWRKQEKRANSLVGARATAASGAVGMDGDGRTHGAWRVESKQTRSGVFTVTSKIWKKLVDGALPVGEQPVLHIELLGASPTLRFVVILKGWFDESGQECVEGLNKNVDQLTRLYPRTLPLDPPAVALTEQQFLEFKAANESSGDHL